jgi:hypothetical protein
VILGSLIWVRCDEDEGLKNLFLEDSKRTEEGWSLEQHDADIVRFKEKRPGLIHYFLTCP